MNSSQRAAELGSHVLAPLVLGGPLHPVRPIGARLALSLAEARILPDTDLAERVAEARRRVARSLFPVDDLDEPTAEEWMLVAALNDTLQLTNHLLAGTLSRGRTNKLATSIEALLDVILPPRSAREALARHATFARILELSRTDTVVSWWTGSASFRGESPPRRLLMWPEARRVAKHPSRVRLVHMFSDRDGIPRERYVDIIAKLLSCTPLTDLATASRSAPSFRWSETTLSLVSLPVGRTLALRALARTSPAAAIAMIASASEVLAQTHAHSAPIAQQFLAELVQTARAQGAAPPGEIAATAPRSAQ